MKIPIITDTHLGARNDSLAFNEYFFRFWENIFFPYLKEHGHTRIFHLGDIFDRRKYTNHVIFESWKERFFDRLKDNGIRMDILVGNHDIPYRNTNRNNTIELFLSSMYPNIHVYSSPCDIVVDNRVIALVPWINPSNYNETLQFLQSTKANICMGHFEIAGFEMERGLVCTEGVIDRVVFDKFDKVLSGHFHHKSTDGLIYYLGNTYEMTWNDYNDRRGFHVIDTDNLELTFIQNPYRMFHKIFYDDSEENIDTIKDKDFSQYEGTFVRIITLRKENPYLFDLFREKLQDSSPLDITIVAEDEFKFNESNTGPIMVDTEDTKIILSSYVDGIKFDGDPEILKNRLISLYAEAQHTEEGV